MASHSSATAREPHVNRTTRTATIMSALVRRAQAVETSEGDPSGDKIEALAEIICSAGDESAGALFVLMGMVQNSTHPEVLANTVKHFAFTRCGELNLFGMVDAQIAVVEGELLASNTCVS
jgi:hypothetical protein